MNIGQKGIDLIKSFEGLRLAVYLDQVGLPTVGYGHMDKNMTVGSTITQQQADDFFSHDIKMFVDFVNSLVKVKVSQNQFDALVSFSYNVGEVNLKKSTLLVYVNSNKFEKASGEFMKWTRAGGKVSPGLVRRRKAETNLFEEV